MTTGLFVETAFSAEDVDAAIQAEQQRQLPLANTDWWKQVITNSNRMAVDEEYRKSIAKDLS